MTNIISFLLLSLVIFISGCDGQQSQTSNNTQVTQTTTSNALLSTHKAKPFDLDKAKQQYAGIELTVADISEQNYNNGSALAVTLTTPLNPSEDFQSFFKVSDKDGQVIAGSWELSNSGLVAYFPTIEPSSKYIVDVIGGLNSATGKQLATASTKEIKTRKMPAQLRFASKGSVLPSKLAKGLPVVVTNINAIDVNFHRIKDDKVNQFLKEWRGKQRQYSYYLQKYQAFSELAYTGRFDINPPKNTRHTTHLDLARLMNCKKQAFIWQL